jgi:Tol biopolymer transport system component
MIEHAGEHLQKRTTLYPLTKSASMVHLLIMPLFVAVLLMACGAPASTSEGVSLQTALPTPTLEPTFTPVPPPTSIPKPSPTATRVEPTLTATPQSLLSGRILDQDTNQPITGAKVRVGAATATTDTEGRYTLTGLPPGQYVLSVTHPEYDPGLSSIFTLAAGQELSLDLALYAPDTSPYPKDPMLTNPLDPAGAPTAEYAERLARQQGLTGEVTKVEETKLHGAYLVNYKRGDEVRAAVATLDHDAWALTDQTGQTWWVIKVCGNLARLVPTEVVIATPQPRSLPPLAEVLADEVSVRTCASETCTEVGVLAQGSQVEVFGCLADGGWCQVGLSDGKRGWCTGKSLQQLGVATAVPVIQAVLPTMTPGVVAAGEGKIAFNSNRDGNYEIYVMNADGSDLTRVTDHPAADMSPAWSPNGQQIAFESERDSNWEVYIMNADGSNLRRLTDHPAIDWCPSWSSDGQHIAFVSFRDGNQEIYVMNADGSGLARLTNHPAMDRNPNWSPDGKQIAFDSSRDGNCCEIYVMNADGSGLARLTDGVLPAWSPDGRQIAFTSNRSGNEEIYLMNTDGSGLIRLTDHPANDFDGTWSPNGKQIAFQAKRDRDNMDIYIINADGSGLTRLTNHPAYDGSPAWSR